MYLSTQKRTSKRKEQEGGQALQLKTSVRNKSQTYDYDTGTQTVGKTMEAWLDASDKQQGQEAGLNKGQTPMMKEIRKQWGIVGGEVVKGHLLNANLGGKADNENLYPITAGANKNHLNYVENAAKECDWEGTDEGGIYYKVNVYGVPDIDHSKAAFDCEIKYWNPQTNALGGNVIPPTTIPSDLEDVRSKTFDTEPYGTYTGDDVDMVSRPKKPSDVEDPKTRVSELTSAEKIKRKDDMEVD